MSDSMCQQPREDDSWEPRSGVLYPPLTWAVFTWEIMLKKGSEYGFELCVTQFLIKSSSQVLKSVFGFCDLDCKQSQALIKSSSCVSKALSRWQGCLHFWWEIRNLMKMLDRMDDSPCLGVQFIYEHLILQLAFVKLAVTNYYRIHHEVGKKAATKQPKFTRWMGTVHVSHLHWAVSFLLTIITWSASQIWGVWSLLKDFRLCFLLEDFSCRYHIGLMIYFVLVF